MPAASRALVCAPVSGSALSSAGRLPRLTTFDSVTEPSTDTAPNVLNGCPPPAPMRSSGPASPPPGAGLPLPPGGWTWARTATSCSWLSSLPYM